MGVHGGPDIVTDGLVFAIDATNEQSYPRTGTTVTDIIGNVTSTLNGTSGDNNTPQWESINNGFNFDGTDDVIATSEFTSQALNHLNIWFSRESGITTSHNGANRILLGWGTNGSLSGIWFGNFTSGATDETILLYQHSQGSSNMTYIRDTADSNFHNLSVNWNGSNYDMYLDGIEKTIYPGTEGHLSQININHLNLGRSNNSSHRHEGNISNCQIYNRALSASEILYNYDTLKGRFGL